MHSAPLRFSQHLPNCLPCFHFFSVQIQPANGHDTDLPRTSPPIRHFPTWDGFMLHHAKCMGNKQQLPLLGFWDLTLSAINLLSKPSPESYFPNPLLTPPGLPLWPPTLPVSHTRLDPIRNFAMFCTSSSQPSSQSQFSFNVLSTSVSSLWGPELNQLPLCVSAVPGTEGFRESLLVEGMTPLNIQLALPFNTPHPFCFVISTPKAMLLLLSLPEKPFPLPIHIPLTFSSPHSVIYPVQGCPDPWSLTHMICPEFSHFPIPRALPAPRMQALTHAILQHDLNFPQVWPPLSHLYPPSPAPKSPEQSWAQTSCSINVWLIMIGQVSCLSLIVYILSIVPSPASVR